MKRQLITIAFLLFTVALKAQVINFTPGANTIIITTNTTIGIGGGNFKTYLVCPGATLFYAESSTMDTILLEAGSTIKFDSAISYGYAAVYAKNGSTVDMNFRQTGKLTYTNGATIIDTNLAQPNFFMGAHNVTAINYIYTNLPGGTGCAPNAVTNAAKNNSVQIYNTSNILSIYTGEENRGLAIKIVNSFGQTVFSKKLLSNNEQIDISSFASGLYYIIWNTNHFSGSKSFVK